MNSARNKAVQNSYLSAADREVRIWLELALYSAAFNWKPRSIISAGRTGYSPEKHASQNCGSLASRPSASPQAR